MHAGSVETLGQEIQSEPEAVTSITSCVTDMRAADFNGHETALCRVHTRSSLCHVFKVLVVKGNNHFIFNELVSKNCVEHFRTLTEKLQKPL